jgi:hypothetical protein
MRYRQPDAGRIPSSPAADKKEFGRENLNFNYEGVKQLQNMSRTVVKIVQTCGQVSCAVLIK